MFTIKHYQKNGQLSVYSCTGYDRSTDQPDVILMKPVPGSGGENEIKLSHDDEVFIENQNGKTIDMIRPSR